MKSSDQYPPQMFNKMTNIFKEVKDNMVSWRKKKKSERQKVQRRDYKTTVRDEKQIMKLRKELGKE